MRRLAGGEEMVQIAYKVSTKIVFFGLVVCLAACAAPPTTLAPVEVGRAGIGDISAPSGDMSSDRPEKPVATETTLKDVDIVSRPDASIIVKQDNRSESASHTQIPAAAQDTPIMSEKDEAVTQTFIAPPIVPEVILPAPISPDVTIYDAANQTTKLASDIAALVDARVDSHSEELDMTLADEAMDGSQERSEISSDKLLGKEALDAAFSLLASRAVKNVETADLVPPRIDGEFRIGVMLPFTGPYAALGSDIANGAELALFQLKLPSLNLIYIDTGAGDSAVEAMEIARNADLDLIIGPLFSETITVVQPLLSELDIPALTFTNNKDMARPNSWVLGYIPEQQIDVLLAQSIDAGNSKIAILAADDVFGQRVLQHMTSRMREFGLQPAELMILGPDRLDEEGNLREAIKQFAKYQKPEEDESVLLPPAPYDSLILAGLPSFLLRVAPVLDYYDLGPDRVSYLGTDLWNRPDLLTEPSLQESYIAVPKQPDDTAFKAVWSQVFEFEPSNFAKFGFDALAVIGALQPQIDRPETWSKYLAREQGFSGFTGNFRLLPDGMNTRQYEIKQLVDYALQDGRIKP